MTGKEKHRQKMRNRLKYKLVAAFAGLVLSVLLAACSSGGESAELPQEAAQAEGNEAEDKAEIAAESGETASGAQEAEPQAAEESGKTEAQPETPEKTGSDTEENGADTEKKGSDTAEFSGEPWKTAYAEVVDQWNSDHGSDAETGYELSFINDDDIPELILFCDDDAWYALDIYTYLNDKAVKMKTDEEWEEEPLFTSPGFQGKGDYVFEKKGIYIQTRGMMGDQRYNGFRMEGDSFKRIFFYDYSDMSWNEDIKDPYSYILEYTNPSGEEVSVEKSVTKEDDFSDPKNIPEAGDLESAFGFSFDDRIDLTDGKIPYDEIKGILNH